MIPLAVSKVIMKLMAKNAEDRYQSADGLQADLRYIRDKYENHKNLDQFILGHTDNNSRFLIPEKLYGREEELSQLFSAFEAIKLNGGAAMVTVSGVSGVGKSRLVHELQRPVVEARGRFASGRFDQHYRGIPFHAFIEALQDLIRQVFSESDATAERFRRRAIEVLGHEAAALIDLLPEVGTLLGPELISGEANISGTLEREDRLKSLLVKFLRIFGPKGRPLVLFLVLLPSNSYPLTVGRSSMEHI